MPYKSNRVLVLKAYIAARSRAYNVCRIIVRMRKNVKMFSWRLRDLRRKIPLSQRAQGLVETALLFPVLLIMLSGLLEFGFILNEYLAMQDAARNAARFSADGLFYARDNDYNCNRTRDFYRQTACLVNQELAQERPEISLDLGNGHDDIVVSGFSLTQGVGVTARHPFGSGEAGWSHSQDLTGARNQSSTFSSAQISARLDPIAPSTGIVVVELFYDYEHKLNLPWITAFVPNPLLLHNYAIMPLVSAEPTATPIP